jgi:FSR family fosmidomycin resistance protein-like MFS transporter
MTTLNANRNSSDGQSVSRAQTLWTACAAHALHDGYTDLIYLLLPIWQAWASRHDHGRAASAGRSGRQHLGGRSTLALGTALAAIGYVVAGYSAGLGGLCVALIATGCD